MRIIFKIILALLVAVNLSFATDNYIDDYYDSLEKKTIPKKFLNKECKKLVKKIWVEGMHTYLSATILDVWKGHILMLFFPPKPELREIERMKNIRYIARNANKLTYDFDFKWINKNTLLVQLFSPKSEHNPENSCELWLFEEKDDNVDVYHFISWNLPD